MLVGFCSALVFEKDRSLASSSLDDPRKSVSVGCVGMFIVRYAGQTIATTDGYLRWNVVGCQDIDRWPGTK